MRPVPAGCPVYGGGGKVAVDIFSSNEEDNLKKCSPLAVRLRPRSLAEFAGQRHLVGEGKPIRRLLENDRLVSMLFFGPPGTGKTTLAEIIARLTQATFVRVNATTSSVAELRRLLEEARQRLAVDNQRTVLFIDEIHRFNKGQQDVLLPAVEKGVVVLIGATTENPYFSLNPPLLSRMRVFPFEPLGPQDLDELLTQALSRQDEGLTGLTLTLAARTHLVRAAGGDARAVLNALEIAAHLAVADAQGQKEVDVALVEEAVQKGAVMYGRDGDAHYDIISAFIKSIRGSDPDAALYWLARMLQAGEDPLFIGRRLIIAAAEDIGNADPHALLVATAAVQAVKWIGLPEGRIPLAQATTYLASAPKSNAVVVAIDQAGELAKKRSAERAPEHLRDASYQGAMALGHGKDYLYPHHFPGNYVAQDYLPPGLLREPLYRPTENGYERSIRERLGHWQKIREREDQRDE
jgi:putative ATPase